MLRQKTKRFWKRSFLAAGLLLALPLAGAAFVFERAMPDYSGVAALAGLSAEARVYRDRWGVPHIFAANKNDAARALGYVHASERLFQMEMQRRAGQGRLSEMAGPGMLATDKYIRTLGLYRLAQSSFAALSPKAQSHLQAYADGVNAWLATHESRLPPEFLLMGAVPERWTPADSVVWGKLMALRLSFNYRLEMLRARLAKQMTKERMEALFPDMPSPITIQPERNPPLISGGGAKKASLTSKDRVASRTVGDDAAYAASRASRPEAILDSLLGLSGGASNEWVVSGKHTATGKPILANDPHLGLEAPILWYLARIVTPDMTVKGATVPGLPAVLLGQNDNIAWGLTTTHSDVQDLFIETADPKDPGRYLTPDGSAAFETRQEIIHVKSEPDVTMTVRATRHGPVMSDIDGEMLTLAGPGKVMALAFTGLGAADTTSEAFWLLNEARGQNDVLHALKLYQAPPQNIVYADREGHIGFINPGLLPIRKAGDGRMPADGASGAFDWTGMASFDQMPQIRDPEAGFILNANSAVVPRNFSPSLGSDWGEPFRARRIQDFMNDDGPHTADTSARMQADHLSLAAKDLLPALLAVTPATPQAKEALALLQNWDGVMDKDRPEPLIFEAWLYEMHRLLLLAKTGEPLDEKGPFAAASIEFILANRAPEWCGKDDADCAKLKMEALNQALAMATKRQGAGIKSWRWGRENVALLRHKFYSRIPLLARLSDLSVESSGDFYTLDRGGGTENDADHLFARTHGTGYRGIYDLANPDASRLIIATGESGHIFSRHYGDLAPLWNEGRTITLAGTEDDLKRQGAEELIFEP
jgi:penicillin amidase